MLISEVFINRTENSQIGESEPYEPFPSNLGGLFRQMQREYGRCVSSMYVDRAPGLAPRRIGWVFERMEKYMDCDETYMREVWVTLHHAPDTVERTRHYMSL